MLTIDGSYGEGGGQIVRTALTLSCITSIPIEIVNIRSGRSKAGLRNQHLTCVHAAATICAAEVTGDFVGSEKLTFFPTREVRAGHYQWDIPTAGAATLAMQTVLLPLALADGESEIKVTGGTHVPFSPSAHYLRDVYAPMLVQSGVEIVISINKLGWNPGGGGEIVAYLEGWSQLHGQDLSERGDIERIFGDCIATNLPAHVPQRMATHTEKLLEILELDVQSDIRLSRDSSSDSKGAGVFLTVEYANGRAGFSSLGELGFPSEKVAEEALYAFEVFHAGNATVDYHLADQLVLALALAQGESQFITPTVTEHLRTNIWVIQQFMERAITVDEFTGKVTIAE